MEVREARVLRVVAERRRADGIPCLHERGCDQQATWRYESELIQSATEVCDAHAAVLDAALVAAGLPASISRKLRIVIVKVATEGDEPCVP